MVENDNRNWPEYNERLVKRGWFYLSLDFVEGWDEELKVMNKRKNGRPYRYPQTFIQFCALIYTFMHLPYRQLEGYLRALSGFVPGLRSADYTTLWERIRKEDLDIPLPDNDIVVAVDSTGIKVTNRGDWIREKHGTKRRGWIKVHLAVDVETRKPVAFEITDEKTADHEMVEPLLEDVKIKDALMDGAYDKKSVFTYLKKKGISKPGVKIRKNAVVDEESERSESVLEMKKLGYDSWKNIHHYGRRWAVESVFSAIKRIFGETVRATSPEGMIKEVARMIASYSILLCL
ncbi:MAG: IS5 family transposase [Methanotrichaceae archaeon]|nr:IS5 family transposase [Methanotrichaceae archaeon]